MRLAARMTGSQSLSWLSLRIVNGRTSCVARINKPVSIAWSNRKSVCGREQYYAKHAINMRVLSKDLSSRTNCPHSITNTISRDYEWLDAVGQRNILHPCGLLSVVWPHEILSHWSFSSAIRWSADPWRSFDDSELYCGSAVDDT